MRLTLLGLSFALMAATATDMSVAELTVKSFYDNLKILAASAGDVDDTSYAATVACYDLVVSPHNGMNRFFPNEFKFFSIDWGHSESSLACDTYISNFKKMAREKDIQFRYAIKKTEPFFQKGFDNPELSFVWCFVEKQYGPKVYGHIIRDTILVNCTENKIFGICNVAGGNAFTSDPQDIAGGNNSGINTQNVQFVNLLQMEFEASRYFTQKRYKECYDTYLNILKYDPTNANACYRLALMSYSRQGCPKKDADKKAMMYLNKADKYGDSSMKEKIRNIRYYW